MAPSLVVAPGRPFVHRLHHLADLGGTAADEIIVLIVVSSGLIVARRSVKLSHVTLHERRSSPDKHDHAPAMPNWLAHVG
jgi:hypothetical protein